jgi:hypothetical protein
MSKKEKQNVTFAKHIHIKLTGEQYNMVTWYMKNNGLDNMSELCRQAILKEVAQDDHTLLMKSQKRGNDTLEEIKNMLEIIFIYLRTMFTNELCYMPEIDGDEMKAAAEESANRREKKMFAAFRQNIKNNSPLFERLLHVYFTDGADKGE